MNKVYVSLALAFVAVTLLFVFLQCCVMKLRSYVAVGGYKLNKQGDGYVTEKEAAPRVMACAYSSDRCASLLVYFYHQMISKIAVNPNSAYPKATRSTLPLCMCPNITLLY